MTKPTKVVAIHKKKGTKYILLEETLSPDLVRVSTKKGWPQTWAMVKRNIKILIK